MKIRYRISLDDFQEAHKLMRKSQSRFRVFIVLVRLFVFGFSIMGLALIADAQLTGTPDVHVLWRNFSAFFLLSIYFLFRPWLLQINVSRLYKRDSTLHHEISTDFTDSGFETEDDAGNRAVIAWDNYDKFFEGGRVFVLRKVSRNYFVIIPKSNMSEQSVIELRSLFAGHLQEG